jgi:photosystem II stability/assembly factor-like uncharacterized protein
MKWLYCLIIILGLQLNSYSQTGWYQQTSGTTEDLTSVYFMNKDTGWVTGEDGLLLKTINGGNSWVAQPTNLSWIKKIIFIDNYTGFLAGVSSHWGKLLKTTDGGNTWNEKQTLMEEFDYPSDIFFIDQNIGWLILLTDEMSSGPYMQKTTDGGETWFEIPNCPGGSFESIYFTDESKGWLATVGTYGVGGLYKTTDGGASWVESLGAIFQRFANVCFLDDNTGWCVSTLYIPDSTISIAQRIIYRTTNAGIDWDIQFCDTTYSELGSIQFVDANYGWTCGDNGAIFRTSNSGNDWREQESSTTNHLNQLFFIDESTGWAVGDNGTILHTATGGVVSVNEGQVKLVPLVYQLSNNFPNPFNPTTKFNYSIPQSLTVIIKIFDILGNEIETLVNNEKPAGTYEVAWNAEGLTSGIYFYQLKAGDYVETKKMMLIK